jgi:hypothetical protein
MNFHADVKNVKIGSTARKMSYQIGKDIRDNRLGKTHRQQRDDILLSRIFLPENASPKLLDPQTFVDELEAVERRKDARTAREIIVSLPNEVSIAEITKIAADYANYFVEQGMCVAWAIHEGKNIDDPSRNNPHMHALLTTRPIDPNTGIFADNKNRDWNKRANVTIWREQLAALINEAYVQNNEKKK